MDLEAKDRVNALESKLMDRPRWSQMTISKEEHAIASARSACVDHSSPIRRRLDQGREEEEATRWAST